MCSLNLMPGYDRGERGLAHLQRITAQIISVQFDQVESIEEDALVSAVVTDEIERGNAIVVTGDSLAINDARAREREPVKVKAR
jgi:hypothetical protein